MLNQIIKWDTLSHGQNSSVVFRYSNCGSICARHGLMDLQPYNCQQINTQYFSLFSPRALYFFSPCRTRLVPWWMFSLMKYLMVKYSLRVHLNLLSSIPIHTCTGGSSARCCSTRAEQHSRVAAAIGGLAAVTQVCHLLIDLWFLHRHAILTMHPGSQSSEGSLGWSFLEGCTGVLVSSGGSGRNWIQQALHHLPDFCRQVLCKESQETASHCQT